MVLLKLLNKGLTQVESAVYVNTRKLGLSDSPTTTRGGPKYLRLACERAQSMNLSG